MMTEDTMTNDAQRAMRAVMLGGAAAALTMTMACSATPDVSATAMAAKDPRAAQVERGKYLVAIGGCNDCHTPLKMGPKGPEPDMTRYLSGHPEGLQLPPAPKIDMPWMYAGSATNTAYAGPWGVSYAINLTSDESTGLAQWTENGFVQAIRTGRHLGVPTGRAIMAPMPWPAYSQMTDEDLKAVFAFLRTVPGVRNRVPDAIVAPPMPAPSAPEAPTAPAAPRS
jgi:mono/diheme cytochrome c family protein